ncbi:hypothetical protein HF650_02040 [Kosakonia sp. SMBL-WEM22]|uniref:hypothetical protein n=1 Tax=Kosakonia sp. SMBL-WEM22 TaxID=2725560 RepID=UPI001659481D|nr:hypothetical protein [Kosakonia sp. SMBL-WEM22]QNQ18622.1 hypothetical protein HF650_02040 [Kosakonia sp. SMBL-WEM22]
MNEKLKIELLKNKDDLIEGTFCYQLFEDRMFNENLMVALINGAGDFLKENSRDNEVKDLLTWVVRGVDQCFLSNSDDDDLYTIKNYNVGMEEKWRNDWKLLIVKLTKNSLSSL